MRGSEGLGGDAQAFDLLASMGDTIDMKGARGYVIFIKKGCNSSL